MSDEKGIVVPNAEGRKEFPSQESSSVLCFLESYLLILLVLLSISLDPLFFYIPVVNYDSNCLGFDNKLRIIIVVLRTFVDGVYILLWCRHKWVSESKDGQSDSNAKKCKRILSWIASILAILPLPQVVVYTVHWRLLTVKLLKFIVLIQFVPRVYLTLATHKYVKNCFNGTTYMAIAATYYFFMFVLASDVLGAFWYLRAIERNMDCWRKACKIRNLCGVFSFYCGGDSNNNGYLGEFCPIPPDPNSTFFDYGLYLDAFERDLMSTHTNFFNKFFYCLWWGLQSLSSLGQNLKPGAYIWDNFFAAFIVISGLLLFALLIGKMQIYLQKDATTDANNQEERRLNLRIIRRLTVAPKKKRLANGYRKIRKALIGSFKNDNKQPLKPHLRNDLFSKVEKFKQLDPAVKEALQKRAKKVRFKARSTIHTQGCPIYEMIHIVKGKVSAFNKDSEGLQLHSYNLNHGDSIGKDLLDKALESPEPNLLLATETIQAVTEVEAFTLSFDDLVTVLHD